MEYLFTKVCLSSLTLEFSHQAPLLRISQAKMLKVGFQILLNAHKKNEMIVAWLWMDLESYLSSEASKSEKRSISYDILPICDL